MSDTVITKDAPRLKLSDRVTILKNQPAFPVIFPIVVLVVIVMFFGVATAGDFFSTNVLLGVFNQALIIGTMATAVSFIYTTGNLDISVGSVMAMGCMLGSLVYNATGNVPLMIIVAIASSVILMMFHSMLGVVFNIKTVTVAIVMMQLYSAIISEILGPQVLKVNYGMCKALENGGFRYMAFVVYFVLCYIVFHLTPIGRELRFIGGNEICACQTGMSSKKAIFISFLMAGIGVGIAATFTIIRTGSVNSSVGGGMGMDVMLATVLGGMSIFGGSKSNTYSGILGALTVSALNKGMLMIGVSSTAIQGVRGVIFLLLVFMNCERPATLPTKQQV